MPMPLRSSQSSKIKHLWPKNQESQYIRKKVLKNPFYKKYLTKAKK
jgi:hypothetical protein